MIVPNIRVTLVDSLLLLLTDCEVAGCEPGWERYGGSCYQQLTSTSWLNARYECESKGSHLLIPDDDGELEIAKEYSES